MKSPLSSITGWLIISILFTTSVSLAETGEELSATTIKAMLRELSMLKDQTQSQKRKLFSAVEPIFKAALASPTKTYDLYEKCRSSVAPKVKERRTYDPRKAKDYNQKRREAREREKEEAVVLQHQLRYLLITMKAACSKELKDVLPELMDHLSKLTNEYYDVQKHSKLIGGPVNQSVFAVKFKLENMLGTVFTWNMSPLAIDNIYDDVILAHLREEKSEALKKVWSKRIEQKNIIAKDTDDLKKEKHIKEILIPNLQWKAYADLMILEENSQALVGMFKLIKNNREHPDLGTWIDELTEHLKDSMPISF
ncbi:hypothetical protein ACFLS1_07140 [Verrucomicrobiota bacterium]